MRSYLLLILCCFCVAMVQAQIDAEMEISLGAGPYVARSFGPSAHGAGQVYLLMDEDWLLGAESELVFSDHQDFLMFGGFAGYRQAGWQVKSGLQMGVSFDSFLAAGLFVTGQRDWFENETFAAKYGLRYNFIDELGEHFHSLNFQVSIIPKL